MRDQVATGAYWNKWIEYSTQSISSKLERLDQPISNADFFPHYVYLISRSHYELLLRKYSRGDNISELEPLLHSAICLWEKAEKLAKDTWMPQQLDGRNKWKLSLSYYVESFWLVGLALALNLSQPMWERLVVLIGNEGEDELLDSVIAVRQKNRKIGTGLCYPSPYRRLLDAIRSTTREDSAQLLLAFVDNWYAELGHPPKRVSAGVEAPYWHGVGINNLEGGAYFGYWCIEAVAVVKAFGIDDSLCIGHKNYPGDLLHADPEPHNREGGIQAVVEGTCSNFENAVAEIILEKERPKRKFWKRWISGLKN